MVVNDGPARLLHNLGVPAINGNFEHRTHRLAKKDFKVPGDVTE